MQLLQRVGNKGKKGWGVGREEVQGRKVPFSCYLEPGWDYFENFWKRMFLAWPLWFFFNFYFIFYFFLFFYFFFIFLFFIFWCKKASISVELHRINIYAIFYTKDVWLCMFVCAHVCACVSVCGVCVMRVVCVQSILFHTP